MDYAALALQEKVGENKENEHQCPDTKTDEVS